MLDVLIKSLGIDVEKTKAEGLAMLQEAQAKLQNVDQNMASIANAQMTILANQQIIMEHLGIANQVLNVEQVAGLLQSPA
jgi:hypothetical protein